MVNWRSVSAAVERSKIVTRTSSSSAEHPVQFGLVPAKEKPTDANTSAAVLPRPIVSAVTTALFAAAGMLLKQYVPAASLATSVLVKPLERVATRVPTESTV